MKKLVIIPTYNEKDNISDIISAIFYLEKGYHILVVDDSSPDGTSNLVTGLQKKYNNQLFLETRNTKDGLGKAYIHGFKWAIDKGYDYIFEMDADFSHNPNDLERLSQASIDLNADVVIGSRYSKGINVVNWPLSRILLSFGASKYVWMITGMPIKDPTAGFVCFKRTVLENMELDKITMTGYGFQIETKFRAYKKKYKLVEVPIIFKDREKGTSKMNGGIISEAVWGVIKLKLASIFNKL